MIHDVIVTGGGGFIGSAVCKELDQRGFNPISFDRSDGNDVMTTPFPIADAVIHLSGVLGTAELFDTPELAIDVNVKGTLNVLQACRRYDMAYVGITMPDAFPSLYTATKLAAVRLATAWHHAYELPVSHVRAFNAFGPLQKFGKGHPQKIVPTFAYCALNGLDLPVWGSGNQRVDLIHVDDIARVLVDAMAFGDDQTFDAGTGTALTVNEVAELIIDLADSESQIKYLPMRPGEIETKICATGEGWDLLAYKPEFRLADLQATVDAYRRYA